MAKYKRVLPASCIMSLALSSVLFGQELTLNDAIETALAASPDLRGLQNRVKMRQGALQQAAVAINPEVGFVAGNRTQAIEFGQEFEYPGKRRARVDAAQEEVEVARNEVRSARLQVEALVAALFYDVLWAQQNAALHRENLSVNERFLKAVRYRVAHGFGGRLDVIKAEVEVARAKRLLLTAQKQLRISESNLRILLKLPRDHQLSLQGDLLQASIPLPEDPESILQQTYLRHPSLQIAKHRLKSAQYGLKLARLSSKPNFSFDLSGGFEENEAAVELGVRFPLALWDTKKGLKEEALSRQKSLEENEESVRNEVTQRVMSAVLVYQTAHESVGVFQDSLLFEAKAAIDSAQKGFEAGEIRFLDLVDAQRTYLDASVEYYNSLRELRRSEIELKTEMGITISGDQQ